MSIESPAAGRLRERGPGPVLLVAIACGAWLVVGWLAAALTSRELVVVGAAMLGAVSLVLALWRPWLGLLFAFAFWYNPSTLFLRQNLMPASYAVTFAGLTAVLLGILLHAALRELRLSPGVAMVWVPFLLAVLVALGVGLARGSSVRYLAADLAHFAELPAFALVTSVLLRGCKTNGAMLKAALVVYALSTVTVTGLVLVSGMGLVHGLHGVWGLGVAGVGTLDLLRASGTFPAALLPVLVAVLPVTSKRSGSGVWPLLLRLTILFTVINVIVSWKRTCWFGAALATVAVLFLGRRSWNFGRMLRAGLISVLVAGVLVPLGFLPLFKGHSAAELVRDRVTHTVQQLEDQDNIGRVSRLREYDVTGEALRAHPALGMGLGSLYFGFDRGTLDFKHFFHNAFLGLAYRGGLLAIATFALGLLMVGALYWRRRGRFTSEWSEALCVAGLGGTLSLLAQSGTAGVIFQHPHGALAGVLLGVVSYALGDMGRGGVADESVRVAGRDVH